MTKKKTEIDIKEDLAAVSQMRMRNTVKTGPALFLSLLNQKYRNIEERRLQCEKNIGYQFKSPILLYHALAHRSLFSEKRQKGDAKATFDLHLKALKKIWSNERLEFLGDAVLSLSISTYLYKLEDQLEEGKLSVIRSSLVNETSLARVARRLSLGESLLLGKSEQASGGHKKNSLLADSLEAVIGAVYIDKGFKAAEKFVIKIFSHDLKSLVVDDLSHDYKTLLQELTQKFYKTIPTYELIHSEGEDHKKQFSIAVVFATATLGTATGASKKKASQLAAKKVYDLAKTIPSGEINKMTPEDFASRVVLLGQGTKT